MAKADYTVEYEVTLKYRLSVGVLGAPSEEQALKDAVVMVAKCLGANQYGEYKGSDIACLSIKRTGVQSDD